MTRKLHLITGCAIALFLLIHLTVHFFALAGPEAHKVALTSMQWMYRNPVIEPVLLILLVVQIGLGIRLAFRRWREPGKTIWARLQLASGLYLGFFIVNHTAAALYTRGIAGLETDFWWVSGSLVHPVLQTFFYPYYALAVLSVGAHLGAVLHFRGKESAARFAAWGAVPVVLAYWAAFGGWLFPVEIKSDYRAYYDNILALVGME